MPEDDHKLYIDQRPPAISGLPSVLLQEDSVLKKTGTSGPLIYTPGQQEASNFAPAISSKRVTSTFLDPGTSLSVSTLRNEGARGKKPSSLAGKREYKLEERVNNLYVPDTTGTVEQQMNGKQSEKQERFSVGFSTVEKKFLLEDKKLPLSNRGIRNFDSKYKKTSEISLIKISLASANTIRQWAEKTLPNGKVVGEVINPETVHYKTLKPIKGGLFCERIFGPLKDFECACGTKLSATSLGFLTKKKRFNIFRNKKH